MANTTDWLNISSQSGSSGETRLTITARRNTSLDYKQATITAYNPVYNITAKTYVTLESYTPYLAVSPAQLGVPASGGTYELAISGNCEWVIAFPDMVSSYSTSAGTGDTVVTFTIPTTQCAATVVGNIVVTDETGQVSRLCRIEQYAEPISILYNPLSLTFPYYGGEQTFSVSANCLYSIASGDGNWYTFTPSTGTSGETDFTVSAASINSGNTDWSGTINIIGPEGVAAVLTMTQLNQGQYSINYTADTSTVDYSGETRTITIDATDFINSSITVTILDAPDVTYSYSASGLTRGIITLNIPQNPGGERNFKVVVSGRRALSQNYSTAAIQYTQAALQLDFVTDTSNVRGSGEVRTITILNSNINPNRTGLNLPSDFPRQGSYTVSGNVITLTYPANPSSTTTRTWTIGVVAQTNDGVSLSGSYQIAQNPNVVYSIPYTADTSTVDRMGETRIITIDASNLVASSITVGVEGATGISATYDNGVITVVFPPNSTSSSKNITVTVTGKTVGGDDASASIAYVQEAGTPYEIPYTADTSTIDITGETRVIYIDASNLVQSSITVTVPGATGVTTGYSNGVVTLVFPNISGSTDDFKYYTVVIEGETTDSRYAFANIEYDQYGIDITAIPLTFRALSDGSIVWQCLGVAGNPQKTISYKINDGEWTSITSSAVAPIPEITVETGDIVRIIGENDAYANEYGYNWFALKVTTTTPDTKFAAKYEVYGNILSMIYGTGFTSQTTLPSSYNFQHLFAGSKCYGAKHLILPSNVTSHCYENMFAGCPLKTAPELPATIAASYCYSGMFQSTMIETAPALPITTFCHNPFIVGGVSAIGCYSDMFAGCSRLKTAPALPATELHSYCYQGMFRNCSSLTEAPALPAISLYPLEPGTTYDYGKYCYSAMFQGCTSLTSAPELSATVLTENCYYNMFAGCTSLTTAPVLPATTLVQSCYGGMFQGCTNLNCIKCLATDISATGCTSGWVNGVASAGTFIKDVNMTGWTTGINGIPTNWVVEDYTILPLYYTADTSTVDSTGETRTITIDTSNLVPASIGINITGFTGITYTYSNGTITVVFPNNTVFETRSATITVTAETTNPIIGEKVEIEYTQAAGIPPQPGLDDPLTFTIITSGNIGWKTSDRSYAKTIEYKKNNDGWISITSSRRNPTIQVEAGDIVQFRGDNDRYYSNYFSSTCDFIVGGNIMSLINSTGYSGLSAFTTDSVFRPLFVNCTGLTDAGNLFLPATALTNDCYTYMFSGCESLTSAPALPTTTLAQSCYSGMFSGCKSLTSAPALPATTLAENCYRSMFNNCTSLISAPELSATTLAGSCYSHMFSGCTSLTTAPVLPVTTLADHCYSFMFWGCTGLTSAPLLPATTLVPYCYDNMFSDCTNLNFIKCLATDISASYCTFSWVGGVASTGSFVTPSSTQWTTGIYGIPSGWTRVDA